MTRRKLLLPLLLLIPARPVRPEEMSPAERDLVSRYMQVHKSRRDLAVGIWFPESIWETLAPAAGPEAGLTAQDVLLLQKFLRPYTLVGLVYARQSGAAVRPRGEAWIRKKTRLISPDGRSHRALPPNKIPTELEQALRGFRLGLALSQPGLADYTYFLAFPNVDKQGRFLIDPNRAGSFAVRVGEATLLWTTPLPPSEGRAETAGALPL